MSATDTANAKSEQSKPEAQASGLPAGFILNLDRTKHFSSVHGDQLAYNLGFIQDGIPFDAGGRLIKELFEPGNRKTLDRDFPGAGKAMARKLARLADEHKAAAAADIADTANKLGEQQPHDEDPDADIDLVAWAEGKIKLLPHVVYRVAKRRFSKFFRTYAEVVAHMIDQKAIDPSQVKVLG